MTILVKPFKILYSCKGLCFLTKLSRVTEYLTASKTSHSFLTGLGNTAEERLFWVFQAFFLTLVRYFHVDKVFCEHANIAFGRLQGL